MIDIAIFKIKNIPGVKIDEWDEEGELELSKKFEISKKFERIIIKP